MPILLNKPVEMLKTSIVTSTYFTDQLLTQLQLLGAIHVIEKKEKVRKYLEIIDKIRRLKDMINYIKGYGRGRILDLKITANEIIDLDIEYIEKDVISIYNKVKSFEKNINGLNKKISGLKRIYSILSHIPSSYPLKIIEFEGKYVVSKLALGSVEAINNLAKIKDLIIVYKATTEEGIVVIISFSKLKEKEIIENIRGMGLQLIRIPPEYRRLNNIGELLDAIKKSLNTLEEKVKELEIKLSEYIDTVIDDIVKYDIIIDNKYGKLYGLANTVPRKYFTVIEGWVPSIKFTKLEEALRENNIPFYIETMKPGPDDNPPTLLRNPRVIRYFEPIIKFLGIPNYREWDPTPVIAYSFAFFYGIMLGDLGYGIFIILAALFVLDRLAGYSESEDYFLFKRAIIVSSITGIIIGIISGAFLGNVFEIIGIKSAIMSFFGVLSKIFNDPLLFLEAALVIGLIHVNLAHVIALMKYIKLRDTSNALSEIGLFIAEIFGIPYILYTILHVDIPWMHGGIAQLFLYGSLTGVFLIIVGVIRSIGGLGVLMWIFNITGLLGDVLSYSRLAGVGLATVYLGASFNIMALMVYNGVQNTLPGIPGIILGIIAAILVAGFGHFINTALSALGAFIHSIRLCFVEFLSKFYEGTGYPFEPLRIVIRKKVVIE
ncbi:MAG: ATPase [Desulfurococcales archaeon]|nr:ATPase [Desulfurococcales archaeon]